MLEAATASVEIRSVREQDQQTVTHSESDILYCNMSQTQTHMVDYRIQGQGTDQHVSLPCICVVVSYLRGEHGQEPDGPTLYALHPEQGVAIVLPAKLYIKNSNEKQVHPHEAVCTCMIRENDTEAIRREKCSLLLAVPVFTAGQATSFQRV